MSGEARRAQIYQVAAQTFYENGYAATSVDQIADSVGILKGSLYYYISSKEDLLFDVIDQAHQGLSALLEQDEQATGTVIEQLTRMVTTHVTYICENPVAIGVFFNDFRFLSDERRAIVVEHRDTYDRRLRQLLEQGCGDGTFDKRMNIKLATVGLLGMVNWVHKWYRPGGPLKPPEIATEFVRLMLRGILAEEPKPEPFAGTSNYTSARPRARRATRNA